MGRNGKSELAPSIDSFCYNHPRPAVTVDVALFRWNDQWEVLLIRRGHPPFKDHWALPGGFIDAHELPLNAARRELNEETGLAVETLPLHQVEAFGKPGRDPRGWTVSIAFWAYWAESLPEEDLNAGDDAADAAWWPVGALPPLAFDHLEILEAAIARAIPRPER